MLGVLGGMGPLATVDFMQKIIALTKAGSDQEHIPMLIHNVPQIPDRSACILNGAEDPFPALLQGLKTLEASGAACVVIPCNTAHFWFERLQEHARVPMISILDCVTRIIHQKKIKNVGLMATNATVAASIYKKRIEADGGQCFAPDQEHQQILMDAIYDIKANRLETGCDKMEKVFDNLISAGADAVILGCTEIPVGLARIARQKPELCIDATELLARASIDWYYGQQALAA